MKRYEIVATNCNGRGYVCAYDVYDNNGLIKQSIRYGIDDYLLCGFVGVNNNSIRYHKIYTNMHGELYVKIYGYRYYLHDFIRV